MRTLLLWGCLLLLLPLLLWIATPRLAGHLVETWLLEQGFTAAHFELRHPGWQELRIEKLQLSQDNGARRLQLDTGPVIFRFDPIEILGSRRFRQILLPRTEASLHYKTAEARASSATGQLDLRPLLPAFWLSRLPAEQLQIGELNLHLSAPGQPRWDLRGALQADRDGLTGRVRFYYQQQDLGWSDIRLGHDNRFTLTALYQDRAFFNLDGVIQPQADSARLNIYARLQAQLAPLQRWLSQWLGLSLGERQLQGQLISDGLLQLPLNLPFNLTQLLRQSHARQRLSGSLTLTRPIPQVGVLRSDFASPLSLDDGRIRLELTPQQTLKLTDIRLGNLALPWATFKLQAPLLLESSLQQPALPSLAPLQLQLALAPLALPAGTLHSAPLRLDLDQLQAAPLGAQGRLRSNHLKLEAPAQRYPALALDSRFALSDDRLSSRFLLHAAEIPLSLRGHSRTRLSSQTTDISWRLQPLELHQLEQTLALYYPALPPALRLEAGELQHSGQARLRNGQLSLKSRQQISGAQLSWEQSTAYGAHWQSSLEWTQGRLREQGSVQVELAATGLPLENINSRYRFQLNDGEARLSIEALQGELLGGRFAASAFDLDPRAPALQTEVSLQQLELANILALEQQQGLSGQGRLSGSLPLRYGPPGFSVSAGQLRGQPPGGLIRFNPDQRIRALAAANQGMGIALDALRNFHYDTLEIDLDYRPEGTALLATRLKGSNPDWNRGHPVDLSINIEENIPKLLQALRYSAELTRKIEQRYQQR